MSDVVVVSPHLDDAILSAWLVLREHPGATVVTVFAGAPPAGVGGTWDAGGADAVAARRREDQSALALVGARPVHLDLLDVQYRDAPLPVGAITEALAPHLAGVAEVWLPASIGGHPDHVLARDAALGALEPEQRGRVYADLPYAGQPAWPPAITGRARDRVVAAGSGLLRRPGPQAAWDAALRGLPVGAATVRPLTRAQADEKVAAAGRYSSQLSALRCGPGHPFRTHRLFGREVQWTLDTSA